MVSVSDTATPATWQDLAILIAAIGSVMAAAAAIWSAQHQWRMSRASSREAVLNISTEVQGKAPWLWVILHIEARDEPFVLEAIAAHRPANRLMIHPEISGLGTSVRDVEAIRRLTDFTQGTRTITVDRELPAKYRADVGFWHHRPTPSRLMRCVSRKPRRSSISLRLRWRNRVIDTSVIEVAIHEIEKQMTVQ